MKLKTLSIIAGALTLALTATPSIVKAQTGSAPDQSPTTTAPAKGHRHKNGIWQKLGLTETQKSKIKEIRRNTQTQIEAVLTPEQLAQFKAAHQKGQGHRGEHRGGPFASLNLSADQKAKIKQIWASSKQQMDDVLTPEQKAQLQQFRNSHPRHRRQGQNTQQPNS